MACRLDLQTSGWPARFGPLIIPIESGTDKEKGDDCEERLAEWFSRVSFVEPTVWPGFMRRFFIFYLWSLLLVGYHEFSLLLLVTSCSRIGDVVSK